MSVPFIGPNCIMERSVSQLETWLVNQAIHVPSGWVEACVAWLIEQHGGMDACIQLTQNDWCQLIYEQWLHTDLHQLRCPVLPTSLTSAPESSNRDSAVVAMHLEGELCLQVIGLFNVGGSYYGQLRRHEGNLSTNLPCLENLDVDCADDPDHTRMTQAFSQYSNTTNFQALPSQSTFQKSLSLFLTDGVTHIKTVELGTVSRRARASVLSVSDLAQRLRPGVKVRIRGPLTLRKNVLLLPPGAIETLSHPQLQILGGEVDELLDNQCSHSWFQLGVMLARKLNITVPEGGSLPSWFPRVTVAEVETENMPPRPPPTVQAAPPSVDEAMPRRVQRPVTTTYPVPLGTNQAVDFEPWDNEDDALITEAAENLEQQISQFPTAVTPMIYALKGGIPVSSPKIQPIQHTLAGNTDDSTDADLSLDVDPDVLASAFEEIESEVALLPPPMDRLVPSAPTSTTITTTTTFTSSSGPSALTSEVPDSRFSSSTPLFQIASSVNRGVTKQAVPVSRQSASFPSSTDVLNSEDTIPPPPPPPKRKPWQTRPSSLVTSGSDASTSSCSTSVKGTAVKDYTFQPFCYIEDMYNDLVGTGASTSNFVSRRRIYTIRGLLISLLSSLEHHQGTRWTLAARLADGSATVDVDIASELLTDWIGLTAAESESLRQMSRCVDTSASNANIVAVQEAKNHRQRLRLALTNFQTRLSNLAGLFDISPPTVTSLGAMTGGEDDAEKPIRPVLVAHRPLDGTWLQQLHDRVTNRWGARVRD